MAREKKDGEFRSASLERLRPFLLTAFLILLGVDALDYVFGLGNAIIYPDLRLTIVWATAMLGLLTLLLFVPFRFGRADSSVSSAAGRSKIVGRWIRGLGITLDLPSENAMRRNVNMMFQVILSVFLLSLLAQQVLEVSFPLDLDFLLVEAVVFGVFSVVFKKGGSGAEERSATRKDRPVFTIRVPFHGMVRMSFPDLANFAFLVAAGIVGASIVFLKTQGIGWVSYVVSVMSGVLIVLVSILVLEEEQ